MSARILCSILKVSVSPYTPLQARADWSRLTQSLPPWDTGRLGQFGDGSANQSQWMSTESLSLGRKENSTAASE